MGVDEVEARLLHGRVDRDPTALDVDRDRAAEDHLVEVREVPAQRVRDLDVLVVADEDHVPHRQPAVLVGSADELVRRVAPVAIGRQLLVELILADGDAVIGAAGAKLVLEQLQEVVADLCRRGGREVGLRLESPQRDLLKPDEIGLRLGDLGGEQLRALGEVRRVDVVEDLAAGIDRRADVRGVDGRAEVGAEVEVAAHHRDDRAVRRRGRRRGSARRGQRQCSGERGDHERDNARTAATAHWILSHRLQATGTVLLHPRGDPNRGGPEPPPGTARPGLGGGQDICYFRTQIFT